MIKFHNIFKGFIVASVLSCKQQKSTLINMNMERNLSREHKVELRMDREAEPG
jgi:hypothetical protein